MAALFFCPGGWDHRRPNRVRSGEGRMYITRDKMPALRARGARIMDELTSSRQAAESGARPGQGVIGIPFPMKLTRAMPTLQRSYGGSLSVAEDSGIGTFLTIMRSRMAMQPDRVRKKIEDLIGSRRVAAGPSRVGHAPSRGDVRGSR